MLRGQMQPAEVVLGAGASSQPQYVGWGGGNHSLDSLSTLPRRGWEGWMQGAPPGRERPLCAKAHSLLSLPCMKWPGAPALRPCQPVTPAAKAAPHGRGLWELGPPPSTDNWGRTIK